MNKIIIAYIILSIGCNYPNKTTSITSPKVSINQDNRKDSLPKIHFNSPIVSGNRAGIDETYLTIFNLLGKIETQNKYSYTKTCTDFNFYTFEGNNQYTNGKNTYEIYYNKDSILTKIRYIEREPFMGNYDLNCYFYKEYIIAKMTCFADTSRLCCQNELPCFLLHDRGNKNTYLFWFMTGSDIDCEEGAMIYSENLAGVAKLKDKLYPIAKLQINGQEVFHTLDISYKNNGITVDNEWVRYQERKFIPKYRGCRAKDGTIQGAQNYMKMRLTKIEEHTFLSQIFRHLEKENRYLGAIKYNAGIEQGNKNAPLWLQYQNNFFMNIYD